MTDGAATLLEIRDLHVDYRISRGPLRPRARLQAVRGVTLSLARGETLGIVGESGSGKSTLARAVVGLTEPSAGAIVLRARDGTATAPRDRHRRIQMVFQDPYASLDPRQRIGSAIAEPMVIQGIGTNAERRAETATMLRLVGLDERQATRFPHQFSGGQRQRIGIARALIARPDILVCDEPVSALDVSVQAQVLNLLLDLQARFALTMLFIAHDLGVVRHVADRVAVMYLGRIVESAPRDAFFAAPLHPYSRALLSAVPLPDPVAERRRSRIVLDGETPSPLNPPSGCGFRTRCAFARPRCAEVAPPAEQPEPGHHVACHFWREIASGTAPRRAGADAR
jgi:oligopeptide transport system ATP-binding protein